MEMNINRKRKESVADNLVPCLPSDIHCGYYVITKASAIIIMTLMIIAMIIQKVKDVSRKTKRQPVQRATSQQAPPWQQRAIMTDKQRGAQQCDCFNHSHMKHTALHFVFVLLRSNLFIHLKRACWMEVISND